MPSPRTACPHYAPANVTKGQYICQGCGATITPDPLNLVGDGQGVAASYPDGATGSVTATQQAALAASGTVV